MPTYTFITDYRGGTYICQKAAESLRAACLLWKEEIRSGGYVPDLNVRAFSKAFDADIDELPPVPLDTLSNVWLFHLLIGDDLLDVHIIQTEMVPVETEATETIHAS